MSATDDERLPPGGFSLRHGFPHWYGRAEKTITSSTFPSRKVSGSHDGHGKNEQCEPEHPISGLPSLRMSSRGPLSPSMSSNTSILEHSESGTQNVGIVDVLDYMKSAFDDEKTMDTLPLEAAGNPGAWNAWRAHRRRVDKAETINDSLTQPGLNDVPEKPALNKVKLLSEWNWNGVWRERVQKGIEASISNSVLYGATGGGDDLVW